ncbi:MAG: hypothetical protein H0U60_19625 [Blastocatellia bacterium]|nr:hypothetical protein [Blastocatellia bacterium]
MSMNVKVECLKEDEEGQCDEMLDIDVDYEAPEYERGYVRLAGGFSVSEDVKCKHHELTEAEQQNIIDRAVQAAMDQAQDYYDGPDCDDRDDY